MKKVIRVALTFALNGERKSPKMVIVKGDNNKHISELIIRHTGLPFSSYMVKQQTVTIDDTEFTKDKDLGVFIVEGDEGEYSLLLELTSE